MKRVGNPVNRFFRKHPWVLKRFRLKVQKQVQPWRKKGLTLRECCERLNKGGLRTFRGRLWSPASLHQVFKKD